MCRRFLSYLLPVSLLFTLFPQTTFAQSGCALQINEVMYHPAAGTTGAAVSEWVELYVAQDIATELSFFITDQDGGVGNFFSKVFVVPAGTASGSYIIINNDGDPANDGQSTGTGIYTTISYFIGNGSVELNNDGDEIVLYLGGDVDGTACDFMQWEGGDDGIPAGFAWGSSCGDPNSGGVGVSISLDPDGAASNANCDWATSGDHSPNNPDLPITGAPHSKGWSNNTTPTAVTLASFQVQNNHTAFNWLSVGILGMLTIVGLGFRRK